MLVSLIAVVGADAAVNQVTINSGQLKGRVTGKIVSFKGISFRSASCWAKSLARTAGRNLTVKHRAGVGWRVHCRHIQPIHKTFCGQCSRGLKAQHEFRPSMFRGSPDVHVRDNLHAAYAKRRSISGERQLHAVRAVLSSFTYSGPRLVTISASPARRRSAKSMLPAGGPRWPK